MHRRNCTLKDGKLTVIHRHRKGSKQNAKAKPFGVNLAKVADKFGELEQSLFGNQVPALVPVC